MCRPAVLVIAPRFLVAQRDWRAPGVLPRARPAVLQSNQSSALPARAHRSGNTRGTWGADSASHLAGRICFHSPGTRARSQIPSHNSQYRNRRMRRTPRVVSSSLQNICRVPRPPCVHGGTSSPSRTRSPAYPACTYIAAVVLRRSANLRMSSRLSMGTRSSFLSASISPRYFWPRLKCRRHTGLRLLSSTRMPQ